MQYIKILFPFVLTDDDIMQVEGQMPQSLISDSTPQGNEQFSISLVLRICRISSNIQGTVNGSCKLPFDTKFYFHTNI